MDLPLQSLKGGVAVLLPPSRHPPLHPPSVVIVVDAAVEDVVVQAEPKDVHFAAGLVLHLRALKWQCLVRPFR